MTTFYICRHGETENNKNELFSGWIDTPLTPAGNDHALAAAQTLGSVKLDDIISSDLGRAFVTAYIISRKIGWADEIKREPALREINYGRFGNQPHSVYPQLTPEENTDFAPPGGESLRQMQARVITYLTRLAKENPGKAILIVGHDGTINAVRGAVTGQPMGIIDLHHQAHGFVGTFTIDDGVIASFSEVKTS